MPRKMRVQYPGAKYHVITRGDTRDDIFFDDADRYDFLKTLKPQPREWSWEATMRQTRACTAPCRGRGIVRRQVAKPGT
jgi:REP element-mobilizing transposase RayT